MTVVVGVAKVSDYPRVRAVLERAMAARLCQRIEVLQAADDDKEMLLLIHVESVQRAGELMSDPRYTRAFFDQSGLEEYPPLFVGDVVDVFEPPG